MNAGQFLATLGIWSVISSAILGIAWFATTFARKNASLRHLIWVTGFIALLLIPAFSLVLPTRFAISSQNAETSTVLVQDSIRSYESILSTEPVAATIDWHSVSAGALALWGVGLSAVSLLIIGGFIQARSIRRKSAPISLEAIGLTGLPNKSGVSRSWELRVSKTRKPPMAMTWGWWTPVVILPQDSQEWSAEKIEAVLMHELAHVRRFDSLSQLLSIVLCAVYWFNPLIWMAAKALRTDAEIAADDRVILSGIKPSVYAAELLRLAAELGQRRNPLSTIGVSIMKQSKIETRILSIVDPTNRRRGIARIQGLSVAAFGIAAVVIGASLSPTLALAQDKAKDTKPPVIIETVAPSVVERVQGVEIKEIPARDLALTEVRTTELDRLQQRKANRQARKRAARNMVRIQPGQEVINLQLQEKARATKARRLGLKARDVELLRVEEVRALGMRATLQPGEEKILGFRTVEGKVLSPEQRRKSELDRMKAGNAREEIRVQGRLAKVEDAAAIERQAAGRQIKARSADVVFEGRVVEAQSAKLRLDTRREVKVENIRLDVVRSDAKAALGRELALRGIETDRKGASIGASALRAETLKRVAADRHKVRSQERLEVKPSVRLDLKVQDKVNGEAKKKSVEDEKAAAEKARRRQEELDNLELNRQKYNL